MKWTPARRVLAAVAIILGGLAAFAGDPHLRPKEVSAVQLAQWIKDRKPGLRIVDLRSQTAFDAYHIPSSQRVDSVWLRAPARSVPAEGTNTADTIVVIADETPSVPSRAYVLRGGIAAWRSQVLNPKKPSEVSRYFGGVRRGGC